MCEKGNCRCKVQENTMYCNLFNELNGNSARLTRKAWTNGEYVQKFELGRLVRHNHEVGICDEFTPMNEGDAYAAMSPIIVKWTGTHFEPWTPTPQDQFTSDWCIMK